MEKKKKSGFSETPAAEKAIFKFLYSYSKEMKKPLRSIYNATIRMQNNEKGGHLKFMKDSLKDMEHLLDDLKNDLQESEKRINYQNFSISTLIPEVVDHLNLNYVHKNRTCVEVQILKPVVVKSDKEMLKLIFFQIMEMIVNHTSAEKTTLIKIQSMSDNKTHEILIYEDESYPTKKEHDNCRQVSSTEIHAKTNELKKIDAISALLQSIGGKFSTQSRNTRGIFSITLPNFPLS